MKTTSISRYGHQLTRYGLVNCYLVDDHDGFTLIDAGVFASSAAPIRAAAQALGTPIRRILLTHAHTDHVGAVDALVGALGADTEVACSARSVPLLQRPPDNRLLPGEPAGKVTSGPGIATRPTRLLDDGMRYGSLLSIATPGHMPGHFSFLDERDGTLYAGDALVGVGQLSVSGFAPWYFPLPNLATWNSALALESARRLAAFRIERFACGHGPVRAGGSAALSAALDAAGGGR